MGSDQAELSVGPHSAVGPPGRSLWLFGCGLCLIILMVGCEQSSEMMEASVELHVPPTTKILSTESLELMVQSPGGDTLVFRSKNEEIDGLEPGDVVVHGVTVGLLRKVRAVEQDGDGCRVLTEEATLVDAIQDGAIETSLTLLPEDIEHGDEHRSPWLSVEPASREGWIRLVLDDVVLFDLDGQNETTGDQIVASGLYELQPTMSFHATIRDWRITALEASLLVEEVGSLEVQAGLTYELTSGPMELQRWRFRPVIVQLGPVPVVLVPVLRVFVNPKGSFSGGLNTGVDWNAEHLGGVSYTMGQWHAFGEESSALAAKDTTVGFAAECGVGLGIALELLIYGTTGPFVQGSSYVELIARPAEQPWWTLYWGVRASAGVNVRILDKLVAEFEAVALDHRAVVLSAENPSPDGIPPSAVHDLRVLDAASENVVLGWTAVGDDGDDGTASEYDLRYTEDLVGTWDDWTRSEVVRSPGSAGSLEEVTVSGLSPGRIYRFMVGVLDEVGNMSPPSNIATSATAAGWRRSPTWDDDFEGPVDGSGARWWMPEFDDTSWAITATPDENSIPERNDRFYRGYFHVDNPQTFGLLEVASDDGLWLYVNGAFMGHWGGEWRQEGCVNSPHFCSVREEVPPITVNSALHSGTNVVAVRVSNGPGLSSFNVSVR